MIEDECDLVANVSTVDDLASDPIFLVAMALNQNFSPCPFRPEDRKPCLGVELFALTLDNLQNLAAHGI
jgi:hypothetical protein